MSVCAADDHRSPCFIPPLYDRAHNWQAGMSARWRGLPGKIIITTRLACDRTRSRYAALRRRLPAKGGSSGCAEPAKSGPICRIGTRWSPLYAEKRATHTRPRTTQTGSAIAGIKTRTESRQEQWCCHIEAIAAGNPFPRQRLNSV